MRENGNHVLITGGATGIGLELARRFMQAGNHVLICGRREEALAEARRELPALETVVADVATPGGREALARHVEAQFPAINVLVNNAGIQQQLNYAAGSDLDKAVLEIDTNLAAPIELTRLLLPLLLAKPHAAVVNVTSGLAIVPLVITPVYSATKAGLRAFTRALRMQLANTSVRLVEVLPPRVNTSLGMKPGQPMRDVPGQIEPKQVGEEFWKGWLAGKDEIAVGQVKGLMFIARLAPAFIFGKMNAIVHKAMKPAPGQ